MSFAAIRLLLGLLLAALATSLAAQTTERVARIGYLAPQSPETFGVSVFRQGLRDLGWVEGRNLIIDYRSADGKFDRLPALAAELAALKVQVIVAVATVPALAAKRATQTIPIVFTHVSDPVGSGLVASLGRPGGNITGFTHFNAGLGPKRLELLKQIVPAARQVAALWHPGGLGEHTEKEMINETEGAARALGVPVQILPVRGVHELDATFATLRGENAKPVIVLPSPIFRNEPRLLVDLAAKYRVPAIYFDREFAELGGLMAYGADMADVVRGAAGYVDRILKGAKPGDLPVMRATRFELFINLKTAQSLGLSVPQSLSIQADKVIR
jgi:putative tryptophan/tyrosine transport system substrate-binding protein